MPTDPPSIGRRAAAEERVIFGCLPDLRARNRLQTALRGHATLRLFSSFEEVRHALDAGERPTAAVVALTDGQGIEVVAFARDVRDDMTGTPVVVYCDVDGGRTSMAALAEAGVHDVLFIGLNDEGYGARDVIFGAALGGAADVVMRAVQSQIPRGLVPFVETAVRRPRDLQRVADLAAAMHLPRQTIGRWCRTHQYLRPEELLVWVRLFIVAVLLETTSRTVESIAADLHYGSPTALRNRLRDYTGMTATQIRAGGLDLVLTVFSRRVDEVRGESHIVESASKAG